jgi:hypothetical protein
MAKFIQKFSSTTEYNNAQHSYPNVSLVGEGLVYASEAPSSEMFGNVRITYTVGDASQEVQLYNASSSSSGSESGSESGGGGGASGAAPTRMWIDGVEQLTILPTYRFQTTGEHIVDFYFDDSVSQIVPENEFRENLSIVAIEIGEDIESIGSGAFAISNNISSIKIYATTPPTIYPGTGTFDGSGDSTDLLSSTPIEVPAESVNTYKTDDMSGWGSQNPDYVARIVSL